MQNCPLYYLDNCVALQQQAAVDFVKNNVEEIEETLDIDVVANQAAAKLMSVISQKHTVQWPAGGC